MKCVCSRLIKDGLKTDYTRVYNEDKTELLYYGLYRPITDYISECLHGENEEAVLIDKIERLRDGKDCIIWGDNETMETFITY